MKFHGLSSGSQHCAICSQCVNLAKIKQNCKVEHCTSRISSITTKLYHIRIQPIEDRLIVPENCVHHRGRQNLVVVSKIASQWYHPVDGLVILASDVCFVAITSFIFRFHNVTRLPVTRVSETHRS